MLSKKKTIECIEAMGELFPDAECELVSDNAFELLISVMLSAQTTDISVNKITPLLFATYPTPEAFVKASIEDIMDKIKTIGLYRNKSKYIKGCCEKLVEEFNSEVPHTRKELESLPGIGRKSANVVLSVAFGVPAIAVDTHVERVSKRLGICSMNASVREVEEVLMKKLPSEMWSIAHHRLIFFGRYQCTARNHDHTICLKLLGLN
ncbi:DNA-(apurinic or apyrimidinic site) lyase /endonuclease III [Carnobacterium iners]|uniref:Endonuclease III n=1 Tax=Carnobacterium iners TaxID=1073423 RepID=A0A1X7NEF9_9LACT|nr:endonuclease III [Carnobacterium iners]SEK36901.1 DNA-(apurinic or apyrimidinic site) lyase /endonuclease III [Carnobacterium iners]SMH35672.1 DNA-(apurinic or apyrimidinic site) lyase /endonuclease III [Carnobacterium iners]